MWPCAIVVPYELTKNASEMTVIHWDQVIQTFAANRSDDLWSAKTASVERSHSGMTRVKPFRQRAGLPAPGEDMGGWYS